MYRWLRSLDVDLDALSLPLQTVGKQNMLEKNTPKLKILFQLADNYLSQEGITYVAVSTYANLATLHGYDIDAQRPFFTRCVDEVAYNFATVSKFRIRAGKQRITPRIRTQAFVAKGYDTAFLNTEPSKEIKAQAAEDFTRLDEKALWAYVAEWME